VSDQFHAPAALLKEKVFLAAIGQDASWSPDSVWILWEDKFISLLLNTATTFQPITVNAGNNNKKN
jgi:hypothetical protein